MVLALLRRSGNVPARVEIVVPIAVLPQLAAGSVLEVRCDPEDPSRVALDPMLSGAPF